MLRREGRAPESAQRQGVGWAWKVLSADAHSSRASGWRAQWVLEAAFAAVLGKSCRPGGVEHALPERGRFAQNNADAPAGCRLSRRGPRLGLRGALRKGTPLHPRALPGEAVQALRGESRAFGPCGCSEAPEPLLEFRLLKNPEVRAHSPRGELATRAGPARRGEGGGRAGRAARDPGPLLPAALLPP